MFNYTFSVTGFVRLSYRLSVRLTRIRAPSSKTKGAEISKLASTLGYPGQE